MKNIIYTLALTMLLSGSLKAEETSPENIVDTENAVDTENTNNADVNSAEENALTPAEEADEFDLLAPRRGDRGGRDWRGDRGGRDWRGDRGGRRWRGGRDWPWDRNRNIGRYTWYCIAKDRGWEEHYSGHSGYGRTQYEAARNAIYVCRLSHGECYISRCNYGY